MYCISFDVGLRSLLKSRGMTFLASGPAFESENNQLPGHQQASKAKGHGVYEHGIQIVMNHAFDAVRSLLDLCQ